MTVSLNRTTTAGNIEIASHTIAPKRVDDVSDSEETVYYNERALTDWGYFMRVPKLKSAILMKAVWTVGRGFTCDVRTRVQLDLIQGNGKETFEDILFNMIVGKQVFRDSYAEIIRDEKSGTLLNLRIINPQNMRIIYDRKGMIKRYEQIKTRDDTNPIKFKPEEILHFQHNGIAGQTHGISVPESVENIILADDENFIVMKKIARFQAVPFIIFKVKADNQRTIDTFKSNIKAARKDGEDLIIPDDANLLSWETVQVSPSAVLMQWRDSLNSEFYRAVGLPQVLFGAANGSTESGSKVEYLAHETVFENDQRYIERQIQAQLGLKIDLYSPTSLLENLQTDTAKDGSSNFAPNDIVAGSGQ